jgi:hypothetical protein
MIEESPQNKMMTGAPAEKAGFHFAGGGVFRNAYIWAKTIEEATAIWLKTRVPLVRIEVSDGTRGEAASATITTEPLSTTASGPQKDGVE